MSGCQRCGGNLYLDENELKCLQCGRPTQGPRPIVAVLSERRLHGPKRICIDCGGPLTRAEQGNRRLRCVTCAMNALTTEMSLTFSGLGHNRPTLREPQPVGDRWRHSGRRAARQ